MRARLSFPLVAFLLSGAGILCALAPAPRRLSGAPQAAAEASFQRGLELFEEARAHAEKQEGEPEEIARRYRLAAEGFVAAWQAGAASVSVFINAANSFHFAGDVAQAVLFYRRALALDPLERDARGALQHIRSTLPIRQSPGGTTSSLLRALFFWHDSLPFRARRLLFLLLFPAAFAAFSISLWRRRPFRLLGFFLAIISAASLGSILVDTFAASLRQDAVVLVEVEGRRGDGLSYSPSHSSPFPAGTEVTVLDVRLRRSAGPQEGERWALVRLLDGSESWVPEKTIERVLARGL